MAALSPLDSKQTFSLDTQNEVQKGHNETGPESD